MNHWEEFRRRFLSKYGELSDGKIEEVEKLLGCGNFQNGFQRYSCEECDLNKDEIESSDANVLSLMNVNFLSSKLHSTSR
ncbi:MAG TPA: transposase zinc-binding domain-containing protein [Leptospiraceae bacterium]|nr:transposase zinc-binding domain-containing protein [Leptospiraceae bacterium]HRG73365.1 transposase zinc-binding domain-containing protein [Leptospiraceae bacterium]